MATIYPASSGPVSETLEITGMNPNFRYNEVSVVFFSDSTYTTTVTSASLTGSVQFSGIPSSTKYESNLQNGNINVATATDLETPLRVVTSLDSVKAVPTSIVGATHWQLYVIGHEA